MQSLSFVEQSCNPYAKLEDASKKCDHTADLDGLDFIVSLLGELTGQLIRERETTNKCQRKRIKEAHQPSGFGHVKEERMVDKPEKANRHERAKIGKKSWTIFAQRSDEVTMVFLLDVFDIRNVIFTVQGGWGGGGEEKSS